MLIGSHNIRKENSNHFNNCMKFFSDSFIVRPHNVNSLANSMLYIKKPMSWFLNSLSNFKDVPLEWVIDKILVMDKSWARNSISMALLQKPLATHKELQFW